MESCTDAYNFTDCLLLSVLDSSRDHNSWDVPTFVVTLVIGFIALTFPFVTCYQAFYGPGRRRCSKYAIGKWSNKTKSKFNPWQFRRDSIAITPLLTTSANDESDTSKNPNDISKNQNGTSKSPEVTSKMNNSILTTWLKRFGHLGIVDLVRSGHQNDTSKMNIYILATWLKLFDHLGIADHVLNDRTKDTPADYLPSEFQAAPAYMEVDIIVILAAKAGCHTLTFESGSEYPLITGRNIQIRFQRDSYLGIVASFQRFATGPPAEQQKFPDYDEYRKWLHASLERSHGKFQKEKDWSVSILDSGSETIKVDHTKPQITGPALSMDKCTHNSELCQCWRLVLGIAKRHNFSWLLYTGATEQNEVFPAKSAKVERILGTILIQGSFWSRNNLSDEWIFVKLKQDNTDWKTFWANALVELEESEGRPLNDDTYEVYRWKVFAICLHFAVDVSSSKKHFFRLPAPQRRRFRKEMTTEMKRIDGIFKLNNDFKCTKIKPNNDFKCTKIKLNNDFKCTKIKTYIVSAALMMLESYKESIDDLASKTPGYLPVKFYSSDTKTGDTPQNIARLLRSIKDDNGEPLVQLYRLFIKVFADFGGVEVDLLMQALFDLPLVDPFDRIRDEARQSTKQVAERLMGREDEMKDEKSCPLTEQHCPLIELLIYRTVLLATICLTSLDNSEVIEKGIGSRIVPFI